MDKESKRINAEAANGIGGGSGPSSAAPFVSVMVLNYRYGDLLRRALEACAAQTFRDFEVVMINNGAIDNTEEIWQAFCEKHPEIRTAYVHVEKNQGPMHGWNEGLRHAHGEYVMFNDADDWMDPDCLEKLAKKAKETGADRVTGQFRDVYPDGRVVRERLFRENLYIPQCGIQSTLFRLSVILENGVFYPEEKNMLCYDAWMVYHFAAAEKNKGVVLSQTLYNYMINPKSLLSKFEKSEKNKGHVDPDGEAFVGFTADLMKRVENQRLKNEIEYTTIKSLYSVMVNRTRNWEAAEAKYYHDSIYQLMHEKLPGWDKNPLLWPFGNGYGFLTSCLVYALVCMDKLHAYWMIRLAGKLSGFTSFSR